MAIIQNQIDSTLRVLFNDSKHDHFKMVKGFAKSIFKPIQPKDFKDVYLSISREQGEDLEQLIIENNLKNIVEFGTSFGISTLFLAQGVLSTGGKIITTELIRSKAHKAVKNFEKAGVDDLIEVRVGDAIDTLKGHREPIDLLLLDGWKNLYLGLFKMLEHTFHSKTIIYVDNVDMSDTRKFLASIDENLMYQLEYRHQGKVVLITLAN